jgi:hypothetical protein
MNGSASGPKYLQKIFSTPQNSEFYSRFAYTDLDPGHREIRLVQLSIENGLVSCRFHLHRLEEVKGKYYSLSYFAGSPHNSRRVLVEGIPFNVFANLEYALRQVLSLWRRSPLPQDEAYSFPLIWVDQICIDQHNDDERSHQVNFMRDIYSNCRETIVSLSLDGRDPSVTGNGGYKVSSTIAWMDRLDEKFFASERWASKAAPPSDIAIRKTLLYNLGDEKFMQGWLSFYDFFEMPWWRRAWVQQEFICSPAVVFMHGDESIGWNSIAKFLPALLRTLQDISLSEYMFGVLINLLKFNFEPSFGEQKLRDVSEREEQWLWHVLSRGHVAMNAMAGIETLVRIKQTWRGDEDLKKMLSLSRHCHSSDPRDRVFAFLGLADRGYAISADYSASNTLEEVLVDTARRIVNFDGDLGILSYATGRRGDGPDSVTRLPSWAPDWTTDSASQRLDGFALLPRSFRKPLPDRFRPLVTIQPQGGSSTAVLRMVGHKVDSIHQGLPMWDNNARHGAFKTDNGHCIRSQGLCKQGDEVWCLIGAKWLFVLRSMGNEGLYILVGGAEEITVQNEPADRMDLRSIMEGMISGVTNLETVHLL